jgi:hypothetical protein
VPELRDIHELAGPMVLLPWSEDNNKAVVIDTKEHSEFRWVNVDEVSRFECVKGMEEDLKAVGLKD